jgi:hypothetical protein
MNEPHAMTFNNSPATPERENTMTTKPLFVLSIARGPISLHTTQEAAEAALQEYAQRSWTSGRAQSAEGGYEHTMPMPATPSEGAYYLFGPANYHCAQVTRVYPDEGPGEAVSLAGYSPTHDERTRPGVLPF